jgi:hypothetical protein
VIDLPPKSRFEPPRYPNVWLYVSQILAPTYRGAVNFVLTTLEQYVGVEATLAPTTNLECADGQGRVHHVQPVAGLANSAHDHYHDLHIRYYFSHLPPRNQHQTQIEINAKPHPLWRLPMSVHYEPEPENPYHPYIDECPVCGVVAPYDIPGDRCEKSHDPLGLELLFYGTIRGEALHRTDGRPVGGLRDMGSDFVLELSVRDPWSPDMNTLKIGIARVMPQREKGE